MYEQEIMLDMLIGTYKTDKSQNKLNLISSKNYIMNCAIVYMVYAKYNYLHTLDKDDYLNHNSCSIKNKSEFEYFYKRFRDEVNTKPIYKGILNKKLCTYCINKVAEQVDHYLPQAIYPSYSIVLANLIPICGTCNNTKRNQIPINNEWFFHPYFDRINEYFLDVHIEFKKTPTIKFSVPDGVFKEENYRKLNYGFEALDLYSEFSSLANNELLDILDMYHALVEENQRSARIFLKKRLSQTIVEGRLWKKSLYHEICKNIDFLLIGYIEYCQKFPSHHLR